MSELRRAIASLGSDKSAERTGSGSPDGQTFETITTGTWNGTIDAKIARFPAGTETRYIRLVGLSGGANYAAATELNIALP